MTAGRYIAITRCAKATATPDLSAPLQIGALTKLRAAVVIPATPCRTSNQQPPALSRTNRRAADRPGALPYPAPIEAAPLALASSAIAFARDPAQILGQDEHMQRIGRRREETEMLVEGASGVVLGMSGQRADAGDARHPHRPAHGILE